VAVYNSAGELVAMLAQGLGLYQEPTGLALQQAVISAGQADGLMLVGTGVQLSWSGVNAQGQLVDPGTYEVMAQIRDSFGKVDTLNTSITVLRAPGSTQVSIYNSAGELVRHWLLPASGDALPTRIVAPGSEDFVPGAAPLGLAWGAQSWDLVAWDGTDQQGLRVQSGVYTVQVLRSDGSGSTGNLSEQVMVIDPPAAGMGPVVVAPNPAGPGTRQVKLVAVLPAGVRELKAWVYDLAGERVAQLSQQSPGLLVWDLGGSANGVYIAVLQWLGPDQAFNIRKVKIALAR
jgi:hypothetical protein